MQPDVPLMAFQQVNLNVNAKEYESPKHQRKQKNVMSSTMHNNALCSPITLNKCSNINSNTNIIKANAKIIEVYEDNFIKEIKKLSQLIQAYLFIRMDTEFPGIVYLCPSPCYDFYYQFNKANIDQLKLIQIGITLFNNKGEYPQYASTWQFNIKFD
jgi:hypothetical protein